MTREEIMSLNKKGVVEKACELQSLLKCLAAVDDDNIDVLRELPHAVKTASQKADLLFQILSIELND